jgi:hypothetical protein
MSGPRCSQAIQGVGAGICLAEGEAERAPLFNVYADWMGGPRAPVRALLQSKRSSKWTVRQRRRLLMDCEGKDSEQR